MDYKLFDDYITLQALLKETGFIQSGGAIKSYLANNTVLCNGEDEKRRGKKLRIGDTVQLLNPDMTITIIEPNIKEKEQKEIDRIEKQRVAELVKTMNKEAKKRQKRTTSKADQKKPVRFPGT